MNSTSSPGASPTGWEPPSPEELQEMLPQYEITGILGRGGMGAVYKGRQVRLDRDVAIKVLPETLTRGGADEMQFAARFELEAQAMAKFSHPSIVSVFDFGETAEGQLFFVMEFVEGMDIHQYLNANGGILSQDHALSITAHVLDALEYAHSRGIVHRDIKPANILLNTEGQVKIADFGLAKVLNSPGEDDGPALTMTNMALGTPDFVAPEALDCDGEPDHRVDLYAVGVMLYQMLTGKLPRGQFKMPAELVPELDPRLDEIVSHSLQPIPDDRYSSASDMRLAMDPVISAPMSRMEMIAQEQAQSQAIEYAEEQKPQAIQTYQARQAPEAKSKKGLYIGVAAAAVIVVGGLVAYVLHSADEQSKNKTPVVEATEPTPPPVKTDQPKKPASPSPGNTATTLASATKDTPFENSLGMRFVPVPITGGPSDGQRVLFSIWETRVEDYAAFIKENKGHEWPKAEFPQKDDHPAVMVNWDDAQAFCQWLTELDRKKGKLGKDEHYRLPTDHEWSCAVGLGREEDPEVLPSEKNTKIADIYPWGKRFPLPRGAGNYYGEETKRNPFLTTPMEPLEGYDDGFDRTAPVGSFKANEYGLYDMGGNVWEWCEEWFSTEQEKRVLRGASWANVENYVISSSHRHRRVRDSRFNFCGFRVVVASGADETPSSKPALTTAKPTTVPTPANTPSPAKPADTPPEPEASNLVAIPGLQTRLDGYLTARSTQVGGLAASYLSSLETGLNQAADAGDLNLVKTFREEKVTVQKLQQALVKKPADPVAGVAERATLPPLNADAPEGLTKLRKIWTSERQKIRGTLDVALQQSLSALEKKLTQSRDFENAEKVMAYRQSFSAAVPVASTEPTEKAQPTSSPAEPSSSLLSSATKDESFENSLGMRFVPVPITGGPSDGKTVLFSIWETRVKDYEEFVKDGENRPWPKPDFEQEDDHPAVQVTWEDAVAFCAWLTERERKKGTIGTEQRYRLPTDHEWSCAVGIGKEEDPELLPSAKSEKLADVFPWGRKWPPPKGAGNYYGEETGKNPVAGLSPMAGYEDPFDRTAPVGSFEPNQYGLHDLGGNAEEWCDDWFSGEQEKGVLRGGSWRGGHRANQWSSSRGRASPPTRYDRLGFRCVLEDSPEKPVAPEPLAGGTNTAMGITSATKDKPFENSLGMRFVPVPITGGPSDGKTVLFSIWETRVEDYAAFIKENNGHEWSDPEFKQADDHPAVNLTWDDAQAFCKWLTELDQRNGKLGKDEQYRLPTDHEWSCAVGIGKDEDAEEIPAAKGAMIATVYPWGVEYPPSKGAGNYNGDETRRNPVTGRKPIKGYDDGFDRTAPVGSFEVNEYGLYDMGGNVWEWCEDWYSTRKEKRVLRGSCWGNAAEHIVFSAFRAKHSPDHLSDDKGFRVVVASGGIEAAPQKPIAPAPLAGTNTAMGITSATKDKPFENSLGMRFVPVPITGGPSQGKTILFSIWETRVEDYEAFAGRNRERQVPEPVFKQRDDHPVVKATWDDAVAFCEWLTEEDRKKGKLGEGERYRLPSDHEWSCAVGIGTQEVAEMTPSIKNQKIKDIYPWGKNYPPPKDSGNYYGEETKRNPAGNRKPIEGYDDGFDRTAPVGSFEANEYGLYDMGGNAWEWCEDWYSKGKRVVRGSSWMQISESDLRSSCRNYGDTSGLYNGSNTIGFRLVVAGVENGQPKPATPKPVADPVEAMRKAGEEYRNGIGMKLCWIPAGTFTMGSPEDEPERQAQREAQVEVELTRGFWMGKYEVTQGDYEEIAGINPSKFKEAGKRAPVDLVSWEEAVAFCEKLTDRERNKGKLPEGWAYALPSEAQWEYACRAGEKGPYSGGDLDEVAWFTENSGGKCHEVGEKKPNAWGLYDMHGNAREWCQDWLAGSLAGGKDPTGPVTGSTRMTRGGSSYNIPGLCRSAHRGAGAVERRPFVGFRVCLRPIR